MGQLYYCVDIKLLMMEKQNYFEKALAWVQSSGFDQIKANVDGYDMPKRFLKAEDEEEAMVPDITGLKRGKKNYIEIALKTDRVRRRVTKWKLLDKLSHIKGGKLYLLAPYGHKSFAERIVKRYGLEAQIVSLN